MGTGVGARPVVRRGRRRVVAVLCVLGTVLLALGTVAGVANRQLVDGARFAAHADEVRQDEAVARQVGIAMTEAVVRADPSLSAVRPLIEATAISVVGSPAFTPVVEGAVRQAHAAVTEPGSGALVLRLADVGAVLAGVVATVDPGAAAVLPSDLDVTLARIGDQSFASGTIAAAHRVALLAWLLPVLALACLAGAPWLLGFGARAWRAVARAVAASGGLVLVLAGVGAVAASTTATDSLPGALRAAVLHLLAGLLWGPGAVLLAAGVLLRVLAAADGAVTPTSVWRDWLALRPASQRVQALRAVVLVGVGTVVVLRPSLAVQALAVLAGLAVLLLGLGEGARVVLRLEQRRRTERTRHPRGRPSETARVLTALPLLVVVSLVLVLAVPSSRELPALAEAAGGTACNGFAQLCDRRYDEVAYAGTHNAMSAADEPGWFLAEQPNGLVAQLDAGIRVLLVDSWYGQATTTPGQVTNASDVRALARASDELGAGTVQSALRLRSAIAGTPVGPVEPYLCHAVCDIGATRWETAMAQVHDWMLAHPREVVTIFVEDYVSPDDTAAVFGQAGLLPMVATHQVGQPWPTLGQMIQTDRRLVVLMENEGGGAAHPWLLQGFDQVQDTNYDAATPEQLGCARNRGTDRSQLLLVNNWLNSFENTITDAGRVNAYSSLYPRLETCRRERGMIPNFVAVNYYSQGDVVAVVDALNGVG
jgi:hypothetical protein